MNRNVESHFALNPTNIDISRSTFDRSSNLKTTFNAGKLIPIYVDEVLPGDTHKLNASILIRMSTPVHPTMDNCYLDTYFFFVPNRLVWEHWEEFNGANKTSAWEQQTVYTIPQLTAPASTGFATGTLADYFGIPTGVAGISINNLPFRAYGLIWNDWFRDENIFSPTNVPLTDSTIAGVNTGTYTTDAVKGGLPLPVSKYHDYFTSALPEPQKGPDVLLPLGTTAPVVGTDKYIKFVDTSIPGGFGVSRGVISGIGGVASASFNGTGLVDSTAVTYTSGTGGMMGLAKSDSGVVADLSNATAATVNQLRLAFQLQKLYEADARGGTRYIELLKAHFGVTSPDARLQRPEYLGGKRIPINITQVLQTSGTQSASGTQVTPQGNTAAYSLTADVSDVFTKSFTEHGFIIGVCCVRTDHTYQQGIDRMWSRTQRFDYYWPKLANIGEQAILNKEIYAQGTSTDAQVFGYQEAWADYRYKNNRVTGQFRSNATGTLDSWHYADSYASLPTLGTTWLAETSANIDRTLAVTSAVSDQFICDIYYKNISTRPMPLYSIPGLIDHH